MDPSQELLFKLGIEILVITKVIPKLAVFRKLTSFCLALLGHWLLVLIGFPNSRLVLNYSRPSFYIL